MRFPILIVTIPGGDPGRYSDIGHLPATDDKALPSNFRELVRTVDQNLRGMDYSNNFVI